MLALLVDELAELAQPGGFTFNLGKIHLALRIAVIAVAGDTPASNYIGGYKEVVGGVLRKCQHCNVNYESMQNHFDEEDFLPRNFDNVRLWINLTH